jgi:uncharacterized protein YndB with AHSA1/START domain
MTQAGHRLEVTLPSDTEVVMTRAFEAPRELVFDALTRPEHLVRWFGQPPRRAQNPLLAGWSMPGCEVDLRVGGRWRYVLRGPEGMEMVIRGVFQEITPPERIVTTEEFEGDEYEVMGAGTLNTMTLRERDGLTTLTITSVYKSREARDKAVATGMEQGAAEGFDRLAELLQELGSSS